MTSQDDVSTRKNSLHIRKTNLPSVSMNWNEQGHQSGSWNTGITVRKDRIGIGLEDTNSC